jgi:hypothetical protein
MSLESLLMTYYAYAHSIMSYDIVFWSNSTHSDQIFKIQKIVRIFMKLGNRDSNLNKVTNKCSQLEKKT